MKTLKLITAVATALCLSATSFAYTINYNGSTVDVGQLDTQEANWFGTLPNYSAQSEANWVNGILGTSFTASDVTKQEPVNLFITNEDADIFAFKLSTEPGYYLIKNGSAKSPHASYDIALFFNEQNTHWGVLSYSFLIQQGFHINNNTLVISHVAEFGSAMVTEPATLGLLALGLLGLGAAPRRVKSA